MKEIVDFFFSSYMTAQQRRMRAALEDGLAHGSRIEPADPQPGQAVTLLFATNAQMPLEQVAVYYTTDGTEPLGEKGNALHGQVVLAEAGQVERLEQSAGMVATVQEARAWRVVLPAQPDGTLVRYCADAWSVSDPQLHRYADHVDPVSIAPLLGRVFAYHVDRWAVPQWWRDAVVYQIFVDRFSSAHDEPPLLQYDAAITGFFGGTLRGVVEKLDYIESLGVNCIWLSPIFESPTYHGYNPSDYYQVSPHYGDNAALVQLIQEAHRRGIRVMLDFVANHTSDQHPQFLAAQQHAQGAGGRWYEFSAATPHGYRSYGRVPGMPELMTESPEVQRYLFDAARYWLEELGADALRMDYVPGPPHPFWTLLQADIKEHIPQALTIGEVTAPLDEIALYAGRLDAFMDFPLAGMLRRIFASRTASLADLFAFLPVYDESPLAGMGRGTLLDNHDMHRFLWLADGRIERLKLAAACQMTLEGTPIIYYGTEVGLSQYDDAHKENAYARAPMLWGEEQNLALLAYYRLLLQLRHTHAALRYGERIMLPVAWSEGTEAELGQVAAYVRRWQDDAVLVVLNNSERNATLSLALNGLSGYQDGRLLRDLLADGEGQQIRDGQLVCTLPACSASIFA